MNRRWALPVFAVLLASSVSRAETAAEIDWRLREELPPARAAALPRWCAGAYVEPRRPRSEVPNDQAPLHAEADRAHYQVDLWAELEGDVQMRRGSEWLATDRAVYHVADQRVELQGGVRLREPGILLEGERAEALLQSDAANVSGASFVVHDSAIRGRAAELERRPSGILRAEDGRFTRCPPGDESWTVRAGRIDIDRDKGYATAHGARLAIGAVPVFYVPWIRFPIGDERQSGFLFPALGYSNEKGFDYTQPYYFNLAPNYDATLSPRVMSGRGGLLEGEFRHASRHAYNEFGGAYMPRDRDFNGKFSRADFQDLGIPGKFDPVDRWLVNWRHRGRWLGGRLRTFVDAAEISDEDYFRDLGTDLDVTRRADLQRIGEVRYDDGRFRARLRAQSFKRLDDRREPYERLPELDLRYRRPLGPFDGRLLASFGRFERDTSRISGFSAIVGERLHVEPRITLPFRWPFAFVRASAALRHTQYHLSNVPDGVSGSPTRDIAMASLDAGLFAERPLELFGRRFTQTLEPRMFYLYQEFDDQRLIPRFDSSRFTQSYAQLFRDNRFTGRDRFGDANHVALGVQTRLLNARGTERFRASIGQIYRFRNQRVTLTGAPTADDRANTSSVVGEMVARYAHASLTARMAVDPRDLDTEDASVRLAWRSARGDVLNIGYRQREPNIEQTELSVYLPLARHWALFGRWSYDVQETAQIDWLAGAQFDNCCWRVRLVNRVFVKTPSNSNIENTADGIFVQVMLKGLAGIGDDVDQLLRTAIPGFRDEERFY